MQDFNTINPVYWGGRAGSRIFDLFRDKSGEIGFRREWQDIFNLPYLASYELIYMWAKAVSGLTLPAPDCMIQ